MLKLVEIKELSLEEFPDQLTKSRMELVDLRMKFASRQLEDPSQIKKKRKEIARLLTVQTQKLMEGTSGTSSKKSSEQPQKKKKEIMTSEKAPKKDKIKKIVAEKAEEKSEEKNLKNKKREKRGK